MVHLASKLDHCIKPVMTLTYFSVTKDIVIIAQWKETSRALHIEGSLGRGRPPLSIRIDVIRNHVGIDYLIPDLILAIQVCQIRIYV